MKKLFISHSSKDQYVVRPLVSLLERLGFNRESLFCSAFTEYGIPMGEDIYDFLRNEFKDNDLYVLFLLSLNYYDSVACLNEMGAAWVLKKDYQTILLPEFGFQDIHGAINFNKIGLRLDADDVNGRMAQLKDILIEEFALKEIAHETWERFRNEFLQEIDQEFRTINLNNSFTFCDNSDGVEMEIVRKISEMAEIEIDFSHFNGKWGGYVVKPSKKDWSSYARRGQGLSFEVQTTKGISRIDLEIKQGKEKSVVSRYIMHINEGNQNYYILFSELVANEEDLEDISEIVFLFKRKYVEECRVIIKDLRIK